jgi:hypothetical protein
MTIRREITESPLTQGEDERIAYHITTTPWGSSPANLLAKIYDVSANERVDVSDTNLAGSASANGDTISTPLVVGLTPGRFYRLEVQFTCDANVFECYAQIKAEH